MLRCSMLLVFFRVNNIHPLLRGVKMTERRTGSAALLSHPYGTSYVRVAPVPTGLLNHNLSLFFLFSGHVYARYSYSLRH